MRVTGVQLRERSRTWPAHVPAAASTWTAAQLSGSQREVAILASGPHAVYLDVDGEAIAVLSGAAVQVPIGLRTGLTRLPSAESARVGDGDLRLGPLLVRPTRFVDTAMPALPGLCDRGRAWGAGLRTSLSGTLPPSALRSLAAGDPDAVAELVGRGEGLTPLGDDVLAAWLVTRAAAGLGHGLVAPAVLAAVLAATGRTTTVSATLLRRAEAGEAVPQLRDMLIAVAAGVEPDLLSRQLDELLAVGQTSGAGLALGAAIALTSPTTGAPHDA